MQITRTEGHYVYDARGRRWLDFVMGWGVGNLGWGHPEIRERLRSYDGPDYVHPSWEHGDWKKLSALLGELSPGELKTCHRATGGTEAVDIALQIAMAYTGRPAFLAIDGAYHGNSIGTVSVGSPGYRKLYPNKLTRCHRIKPPLDESAVEQVEARLRKRDVAALIMEPVVLSLDVHVPTDGFMREVSRLCRRYGTLLVMDEVACGFGRTGKLFASEHYGLEPDILCLAKALTGGYAAMGATLTTERISKKVGDEVSFYSTYGWHPLSVAAALANVQFFRRNGRALMKNVASRSRQLEEGLLQVPFEVEPAIQVKGLALSIGFDDEEYAEAVTQRCEQEGLLVSNEGDAIMLLPALTLDEETAREGLEILGRCV